MPRLLVAVTLAAIVAGLSHANAQTYPARPITMIVPLAPGGSTDVIGRIMAEGMRVSLGQPIVVENVTGAGGTLGVGRLARATPDGYTFGIGQWGTNMANGAIYSLQYDLVTDFEPIALIATQPFLIVARKNASRQGPCGAGHVAEDQHRQGLARQFRHRHAQPCGRHLPAERDRRALAAGALSQRRPVDAGSDSPATSTSCSTPPRCRCRRCAPATSGPMR